MPGARPIVRTYPAVAESEARGATATLFAEIRRALGVPVVNLIWRHLATLPRGPRVGLGRGRAGNRRALDAAWPAILAWLDRPH